MLNAWLVLFGCQLMGELIRAAMGIPVPGPVLGLFLLAMLLVATGRGHDALLDPLETLARSLIGHMGLLFVPAGVGVITELRIIRDDWLPISAAVLGSTILSMAITGAVMHWVSSAETHHG